jgi:hypothetical protein
MYSFSLAGVFSQAMCKGRDPGVFKALQFEFTTDVYYI